MADPPQLTVLYSAVKGACSSDDVEFRRKMGGSGRVRWRFVLNDCRDIMHLVFEDAYRAVEADDCTPLLARYDRVVEYDAQRSCYEGFPVAVLDKGHITSALAADLFRTHLLDAVRES